MHKKNIQILKVSVPVKKSYSCPIFIGKKLLVHISYFLPKNIKHLVLITDNKVKKLLAEELFRQLKSQVNKIFLVAFSSGERHKNDKTVSAILDKIFKENFGRDTIILAVGGGVVGDIAGFIAGIYMRGIPYVQIPTTLLSMLDSSIGGKTGINTAHGKNLVGVFWHPKMVITDVSVLSYLPKKQIINGFIEALKMFLTHDRQSFHFAIKHCQQILACDETILIEIIKRALKIKSLVVEKDPEEKNLRMVLNFGHTIGHALENITQYKLLHGFAVGYGILVEAQIAVLLNILSEKEYQIIKNLFSLLGIKPSYLKRFNIHKIIAATKKDKKSKEQKVHYILLKKIGSIYKNKNKVASVIPDALVENAFLSTIEA